MIQYISDNSGHTTAVIIPIEEWNNIRNQYPAIDTLEGELPQWQKDIIDKNLQEIADHPERLHPIEKLFAELDTED